MIDNRNRRKSDHEPDSCAQNQDLIVKDDFGNILFLNYIKLNNLLENIDIKDK